MDYHKLLAEIEYEQKERVRRAFLRMQKCEVCGKSIDPENYVIVTKGGKTFYYHSDCWKRVNR